MGERNHPNEPGNFWVGERFYKVRCYACGDRDGLPGGRENYLPAAASGRCAWCGHEGPYREAE